MLFCSKPFKWFEVSGWYQPKGDVFLCCPQWLPNSVGNLQRQSVEAIWNGERAKEIRRSILDGSFKFCDHFKCPFLSTRTSPVEEAEFVRDQELRDIIDKRLTKLQHGPQEINCSYDKSCNLSCPSCRTQVIVESENSEEILRIQDKIRKEALRDARLLYITGSGDPFGSPFYRKWLQTMRRQEMPTIERIHIHTNAQLWTAGIWKTINEDIRRLITSTEISIDAASADTYSVNRRGGSFARVLENLEFISSLRRCGPLKSVTISMVVQENNFREMPDFIQLGKRFNCDTVYFSQIVNWGTYSAKEFKSRAICIPYHHRHKELADLLKSHVFRDPIVHLGNLSNLTQIERETNASQRHTDHNKQFRS